MTDFTRRKAIAVAVGTMAGASAAPRLVASAAAADMPDLEVFVRVSAELTGIEASKLAPDIDLKDPKKPPGVDPIKIKQVYFDLASKDPAFANLLKIARDAAPNFAAAAEIIAGKSTDDVKFLGRSIILAWYLGAWYPPAMLQQPPKFPTGDLPENKVISAAAYTQGWTWRVAQAHPMGYSELRFGHWSDAPLSTTELIGKEL
jgi:hypothetical protein